VGGGNDSEALRKALDERTRLIQVLDVVKDEHRLPFTHTQGLEANAFNDELSGFQR
jgi:hypothetical protein